MEIVAPLFDDMRAYIEQYFDKGEIDEKMHTRTAKCKVSTVKRTAWDVMV
ncbi:MAG: hypothetical protein GWP10_18330 [Nitrospiraceae bacterium]|nr:hypothetical protein [Nitrospiraceae bacterium]